MFSGRFAYLSVLHRFLQIYLQAEVSPEVAPGSALAQNPSCCVLRQAVQFLFSSLQQLLVTKHSS